MSFILLGVTIYEFDGDPVNEKLAQICCFLSCAWYRPAIRMVHGCRKMKGIRRRYPVMSVLYTTEEIDKFHKI